MRPTPLGLGSGDCLRTVAKDQPFQKKRHKMETLKPTQTLEQHIRQAGITTGSRKLEMIKLALALRGTPPLRSQEGAMDPIVHVKLFDPCTSWTWLILEWNQDTEAFGVIVGHEAEFGYIDLNELSSVPGALGIGIEVDVSFLPQPLSRVAKDLSFHK